MNRFFNIVHSGGFREVVRYMLGCGGSLLLKISVTSIMTAFHVTLPIAYFIATTCAVLFAFFYHRHVTFCASINDGIQRLIRDFVSYVFSVFIFCLIDYLIVVIAASKLKESLQKSSALTMSQVHIVNNICIIGSSILLFVLRFFVYRLIFKSGGGYDTSQKPNYDHQ